MNNLLVLLLGLVLLCTASPIKREAMCLQGKVNCALHVVNEMERDRAVDHDINIHANYSFPLGHKVLCYVFDQYNEFTELPQTIAQSNCQPINGYKTNQTLILESLEPTCEWVRLNEDISQPNCTLTEIKEACTEYRVYEHKMMIATEFAQYRQNCPIVNEPIIPELYGNISGIPSSTNINIACNI